MKTVKIKDYYGIYQEVPVSDEVYEEWLELHREEDRLHKKKVYHHDNVPFEQVKHLLFTGDRDALIDQFIRENEFRQLYDSIKQLTPTQQRRIYMLLDGMNYTDIARAEGCKFAPVYRSIHAAFEHLRKLLSN